MSNRVVSYSYDAVGNRVQQVADGVTTAYAYDAANQLLSETTGATTTAYAYDPNGNLTGESSGAATTTYAWDGENRLTGVSSPTGSRSYAYGADGLRRSSQMGGTVRRFLWDEQNLLEELDSSGQVLAHYTDWPGMPGGLISRRQVPGSQFNSVPFNVSQFNQGGVSRFYGFDQGGNTRLLTNEQQGITDRYAYGAFGEELEHVGNPSHLNANPYAYGGRYGYYRDTGERLYVRARHLEVKQGQWISQDPIGFEAGDANLYKYVGNNPVNDIDASGLQSSKCEIDGCPTCGPEVGHRLRSALGQLARDFRGRKPDKKRAMCQAIAVPGAHQLGSWELTDFYGPNFANGLLSPNRFPNCATPDCAQTVRVFGQCHKAGIVNYIVYGFMSALCYQFSGRPTSSQNDWGMVLRIGEYNRIGYHNPILGPFMGPRRNFSPDVAREKVRWGCVGFNLLIKLPAGKSSILTPGRECHSYLKGVRGVPKTPRYLEQCGKCMSAPYNGPIRVTWKPAFQEKHF